MTPVYNELISILEKGVVSEKYASQTRLGEEDWKKVLQLAKAHHILPIVAESVWDTDALPSPAMQETLKKSAMSRTSVQASRTAEFLRVYDALAEKGLRPAVLKGIVVRCLYPHPEQRESVDEDLLISPSEIRAYHKAFLALGFTQNDDENPDTAAEISYLSREKNLCIELHKYPFPPESTAYGECNRCFRNALRRAVDVTCYDRSIRTLHPTDHLLYMICHAYKHFLHGGVGIRQICDMGMLTKAYGGQMDWNYIYASCRGLRIEVFAAAMFKISTHLGFCMPDAFREIETDEYDLLSDILSGGLYGTADVDRLHSSMITLNTAAAYKNGKKKSRLIRTLFPAADSLTGRYPYLRDHSWLLPVAWTHRMIGYIKNRKRVDPKRSLQIGKERVQLLKEYGVID